MKFWILFLAVFPCAVVLGAQNNESPQDAIIAVPYYTYSQADFDRLSSLSSSYVITQENLKKWDALFYTQVKKIPSRSGSHFRMYAYLYTAQRDVIFLSYQAHQAFKGSIDPISFAILRLFFPTLAPPFEIQTDEYTEALTKIVFQKFQERFKEDQKQIKQNKFVIFNMPGWTGYQLALGESIQFWKPWEISYIGPGLVTPIAEKMQREKKLEEAEKSQYTWTERLGKMLFFWTFMPRKEVMIQDWLQIANAYMYTQNTPLEKMILVRSLLAMAICDTLIAVFQSRYTFQPLPSDSKNPATASYLHRLLFISYPSVHASIAIIASKMLTHFFPENQVEWERLAAVSEKSLAYPLKPGLNQVNYNTGIQ